jgi:pimeloyl-ACP methyl ester carboxylesterase
MENKFVTVNGHRMRYLEEGSGTPIVMLHGLGFNASADQWRAVFPLLSANYRCLALDQVGWGWSDRPVDGYSFPKLVAGLEGFIEALALREPIVIGHTLGGWTAALLAEKRPDLVAKLILANTAGVNPTAPRAAGTFTLPSRDEVKDALERTFEGSYPVSEEMVDDEMARQERPGIAESYTAILQFVNDPALRSEYNLRPRLGSISCPTLVVWGADDPVLGRQFGEEVASYLTNGELVFIEQGAHAPFARRPAEFVEAVQKFIKSN